MGFAVARAMRDRGIPSRDKTSQFTKWLCAGAVAGRTFESIEQAQAEFEALTAGLTAANTQLVNETDDNEKNKHTNEILRDATRCQSACAGNQQKVSD